MYSPKDVLAFLNLQLFPCFVSFSRLFDDDEFDRLVVIASDRPSVFLVDQYARLDSPAAQKYNTEYHQKV